jgi:hypothetical protein
MFCLGKSALECYKSLKEGLETHASSYKTVYWLVNIIKNGWKETDSAPHSGTPILATDECHIEQVKSVSGHTQIFIQGNCYRSQNLSNKCVPSPHQQLGKMKSLFQVDFICAQQWLESHVCSSCHHWFAALEQWRQCIPQSHINSWWIMDAFIWPSAEMTECRMVCPSVTLEDKCMAHSGCSESHAHIILQPKWTCVWTSSANWCDGHGQDYCALLQGKVRQALHYEEPEVPERSVILLQDNA